MVLADPKDRNKDIVVFLASEHQADAPDEAEQRAAVTALHRVAGDRALHRVLPDAYRPLWQELCTSVSPATSPIGSQCICATFNILSSDLVVCDQWELPNLCRDPDFNMLV